MECEWAFSALMVNERKHADLPPTPACLVVFLRDTNEYKNVPSQDLMGHCPVSALILSIH